MSLNLAKCLFGIQKDEFLSLMLTKRGLEENPYKCQAIIDIRIPYNVKEFHQLSGHLAALSFFFHLKVARFSTSYPR